MENGILSGLRVVDLTRVVAGPYATRILADFGAEVIKVQTGRTATGAEDNVTGYFNAWNRNKKGISLNLNHREAQDLFCRLVALSDVVAENFTPRVMTNWGLSYDALKAFRQDLIMLSMSGMGQTGPWKDFAAYGPTLQSLGGLTYLTSFSATEPLGLGYSYADPIMGIYGAISVLAALEYREQTGVGQHIDLSGYEAVCTLIGPELLDAAVNKRNVSPAGNSSWHGQLWPAGCYPCRGSDQWCVIALSHEHQWPILCQIIGRPAWCHDERFATSSGRGGNHEVIDDMITSWAKKHATEEVVKLLQEAGVPAGVVQDAAALACDPQLIDRKFFAQLHHPLLGISLADTYPFQFPESNREDWQAAPLLGADNEYVFRELLGLTLEEIGFLKEKGAIG